MVNIVLLSPLLFLPLWQWFLQSKSRPGHTILSADEAIQNTRVFEESSKRMELTVAEALAEKARDPRLATMTQEDLAYEV